MASNSIFESKSSEQQWVSEISKIINEEVKVEIIDILGKLERRWVNQISKTIEDEVKVEIIDIPVSIFRVPTSISAFKPEAYTPQLIGLGPYHRFKPELYEMERYKVAAATRVQKEFRSLEFKQLVDMLSEVDNSVRACYHKFLDIDGDTLAWIMAIDGLFLLDFLNSYVNKKDRLTSCTTTALLADASGKNLARSEILSDIVMLENQIPIFVLSKILTIQTSSPDVRDNLLPSILTGFCQALSPLKLREDLPLISQISDHSHLLDLLYHLIVPALPGPNGPGNEEQGGAFNIDGNHNTDSVVTLNVNSEVVMRNLVAYEASIATESLVFARYTELMNGIIDTAEDATLLREKKIIVNSLKSDAEVSELFNGMSKSVRLTNVSYIDKAIGDANSYFFSSKKVRVYTSVKKYVYGSWRFLTIVAVILIILMTALESFCSVYTCIKNYHPFNINMAKSSIFDSSSHEEQWINQIKKIVEEEVKVDIEVPVCIFNIPATLASFKPEAYVPQLMGLGPYHHGDPDLYDMERYKLAAATRLQKQFKTLEFEQLVDKLMEFECRVRLCYHKYLEFEGNTLMWIMAIDGLFLLEFLFTNKDDSEAAHLVDSAGKKLYHDSILSDVMLLENQIPFFLFSKIRSIQYSQDDLHDNCLPSILTTFCHSISPVKLKDFPLTGVLDRYSHLLDLLYHMIVPELADQSTQEAPATQESLTESKSSQQADSANSYQIFTTLWEILSSLKIIKKIADNVKKIITGVPALSFLAAKAEESKISENSQPKPVQVEKIMIPSASNLSKIAGVEFCPSPTPGDISTIKFDDKEKKFYLPIITLNVHSEVIIRNLIAYEASTVSDSLVFSRYTELLDGIIDTAEDAKLLREKKIIVNKLKSDDAVLQLFDGIGKSVRLTNAPYFDKMIEDVNKFFYNSRRVWIYSGVRKYVFGSWKILTLLAGILLLLLTGLQSFCSVYTCSDMINSAVRS
ncbi:hypothetical protein RHMOL_Rhmol01G0044600 [Rhododendron molle]|uniref:Uncharacterized protein n=1 Tax=Rhododendron molle TaxID=49168 RepID=A0ACC0PYM3_RHOML|nr:hypothetical protein RHMOL_Rhmol01G0044600 [Rhododendron molle]